MSARFYSRCFYWSEAWKPGSGRGDGGQLLETRCTCDFFFFFNALQRLQGRRGGLVVWCSSKTHIFPFWVSGSDISVFLLRWTWWLEDEAKTFEVIVRAQMLARCTRLIFFYRFVFIFFFFKWNVKKFCSFYPLRNYVLLIFRKTLKVNLHL